METFFCREIGSGSSVCSAAGGPERTAVLGLA